MGYQGYYDEYGLYNRFENLDGLEAKIVEHLLHSTSKHAENFWKLLKYTDMNALSMPSVPIKERWALISNDNGTPDNKRVFLAPFMDDAWAVQCSSVYIFMDKIKPVNNSLAVVGITIETVTHSKISIINGDGDPELNETIVDIKDTATRNTIIKYGANPNDSDSQGSIVVPMKNRESVLVKSLVAELNGLYLDGVGCLALAPVEDIKEAGVSMPLFNSRSFYGHTLHFLTAMSGLAQTGNQVF